MGSGVGLGTGVAVAMVQLALVLAVALLWFDVPFRGDPGALLLAVLLLVLAGLADLWPRYLVLTGMAAAGLWAAAGQFRRGIGQG